MEEEKGDAEGGVDESREGNSNRGLALMEGQLIY